MANENPNPEILKLQKEVESLNKDISSHKEEIKSLKTAIANPVPLPEIAKFKKEIDSFSIELESIKKAILKPEPKPKVVTSQPVNSVNVESFIKEVGAENIMCSYGSRNRVYFVYRRDLTKAEKEELKLKG